MSKVQKKWLFSQPRALTPPLEMVGRFLELTDPDKCTRVKLLLLKLSQCVSPNTLSISEADKRAFCWTARTSSRSFLWYFEIYSCSFERRFFLKSSLQIFKGVATKKILLNADRDVWPDGIGRQRPERPASSGPERKTVPCPLAELRSGDRCWTFTLPPRTDLFPPTPSSNKSRAGGPQTPTRIRTVVWGPSPCTSRGISRGCMGRLLILRPARAGCSPAGLICQAAWTVLLPHATRVRTAVPLMAHRLSVMSHKICLSLLLVSWNFRVDMRCLRFCVKLLMPNYL